MNGVPSGESPVPATARPRLAFVDNLRGALTVLVVAHHAAQAYGPTGGAWPVGEAVRSPLLGFMISVNAMFFMGLFFFVSGYFLPAALARKGPGPFVRDRLLRLGVPCGLVLAATGLAMDRPQFLHLWFVVDLLALNLLAAAAVRFLPAGEAAAAPRRDPGAGAIAGFVVALGLATAAVRIAYPVDAWVDFLGVLPVEPAHAPQYLALFGLGCWAGRGRWLERLPDRIGRGALLVAAATIGAYALYRFWPGRTVGWFATGGLNPGNLALSVLESVVCVTLGLGLLWGFRERLNREWRVTQAFSVDAYGVYLVHLPLVVLAHHLLLPLPAGPLVKFALATTAGVLASWLVTRVLLRSTALGRRVF